TAMLTTTYLKAYREEKNILLSNVIAVALSIVVAGLTVFLAESLTLAVLAITLLCMVKAYLTEFFVCRHLSFPLWRELIIESILMTLFMLSGWYLGYLSAMCLYASGYILYLIAERKHINKGIDLIKQK
ncbi:MAG: hypothetical protein IIW08_03435, partial [Clostridia bacterium]|nr:hypothetical protein [Clostridia bacterium]